MGNTQYVAYVIQENTGADLFRIEPEVPYPTDHDTLVDQAAEEQDNGARPAIKDTIENFDQYVKRLPHTSHERRRLIELPSSAGLESITLVSGLLQYGHFI